MSPRVLLPAALSLLPALSLAADAPLPALRIGLDRAATPGDVSLTLQILVLLTVLSLAPALLMMLTSFTRIVIVLSFLRNAIGTPAVPPNQVLIGLSLFLTFFTMSPVLTPIYEKAFVPYSEGRITQTQALAEAKTPLQGFMLRHTSEKDIAMFVRLAKEPRPRTPQDVSMTVLIPSFLVSELRTAFTMGFLIYVPFVVIDMVVASILMSMGMFMLPPMMVSLPFKLILFVVVDGWGLVVESLTRSVTG